MPTYCTTAANAERCSEAAYPGTKKIVDSSAVVSRMTDEFKIAEISAPENKNSWRKMNAPLQTDKKWFSN